MSASNTVPRVNNTGSTRGRPFAKGNQGRPRGSRNKTRLALESLLEGEAERLTRKAVELALGGDITALKLCLDRLLPPRRDRPVLFALPPLNTPTDAVRATAALLQGAATGELTPTEAEALSRLVAGYTRAVEVHEIENRLAALEQAHDNARGRR
jgi:hypothetical protein